MFQTLLLEMSVLPAKYTVFYPLETCRRRTRTLVYSTWAPR
jgi:hypothetical protein